MRGEQSSEADAVSESPMSDILYLALGLGMLALFALYARGLGRI